MVKKTLSNIKTIFAAVIVVVIALCLGLVSFGCGNDDEGWREYVIRIAKEEFGCEKILWHIGGICQNEVSSVFVYNTNGYKSTMPYESAFEYERKGSYVLGVDKYGRELFIAIPSKESTKRDPKKYSPRLIQWPFEYSFTEIATFAAEHGYKYADGIDGLSEEQLEDYSSYKFIYLNYKDEITDDFTKYFDYADKKYDELDAKFVLFFRVLQNEDRRTTYYITQESGKLVLYEEIRTQLENNTVHYSMSEVATLRRRKLKDAVNIAREDFGCEKILWVDYARPQNNVLENNDTPDGGCYVVGEDKDGSEVYVVVPYYETEKHKPSTFQWKFDYTFSQIARVFAKYGYKYADGIDGMEDKYTLHDISISIFLLDMENNVKSALAHCGDADELYEKLDVKLVFYFRIREGRERHYFWLTQQDGSLVMYEIENGDIENFTKTVYNKDNI